MKKHIVIGIRYSLFLPKLQSWNMNKGIDVDVYRNNLFNKNRLRERLSIFTAITLKSLDNIYKHLYKDTRFFVFVLTSEDLPEDHKNSLELLSEKYDFLKIKYYKNDEVDINQYFAEYYNYEVDEGDVYASVRLDDDDALSLQWYYKMDSFMKVEYDNTIISLSNGLAILIDDDLCIDGMAEFKWRLIALGLSYIGIKSKEKFISIYETGDHMRVDEKFNTLILSDNVYWIRTYGKNNDSGHVFNFKDKYISSVEELSKNFGLCIKKKILI